MLTKKPQARSWNESCNVQITFLFKPIYQETRSSANNATTSGSGKTSDASSEQSSACPASTPSPHRASSSSTGCSTATVFKLSTSFQPSTFFNDRNVKYSWNKTIPGIFFSLPKTKAFHLHFPRFRSQQPNGKTTVQEAAVSPLSLPASSSDPWASSSAARPGSAWSCARDRASSRTGPLKCSSSSWPWLPSVSCRLTWRARPRRGASDGWTGRNVGQSPSFPREVSSRRTFWKRSWKFNQKYSQIEYKFRLKNIIYRLQTQFLNVRELHVRQKSRAWVEWLRKQWRVWSIQELNFVQKNKFVIGSEQELRFGQKSH